MVNQGELRKVDELGRVVIPKEIRDILEIKDKTPALMSRRGNRVMIRKFPEDKAKIEGISRKFDELGRIVIPMGMRNATGMIEGARVTVELKGEIIIIELYQDGCVFCSQQNRLTKFKNKFICKSCMNKIKELSEE